MKSTLASIFVAVSLLSPMISAAQNGYTPPAPKPVLSCDGLSVSSLYDGGFQVTVTDKAAIDAITQTITSQTPYMQAASQPYTGVTLDQVAGRPVEIRMNDYDRNTNSYYVSPGASEANFMQKTALYPIQQDGVSGMSLRISTSTNAGTRDSDVNWKPIMSEIFFKNCK